MKAINPKEIKVGQIYLQKWKNGLGVFKIRTRMDDDRIFGRVLAFQKKYKYLDTWKQGYMLYDDYGIKVEYYLLDESEYFFYQL